MREQMPPRRDVLIHLIINNVLIFLAMIALILRLIARRIKRNPLGADDYFIIIAMVSVSRFLSSYKFESIKY
jgi:hypothetical protein